MDKSILDDVRLFKRHKSKIGPMGLSCHLGTFVSFKILLFLIKDRNLYRNHNEAILFSAALCTSGPNDPQKLKDYNSLQIGWHGMLYT